MNTQFEHSEFLKQERKAACFPRLHSDVLVSIDAGQFARFDSIAIEVLNGSVIVTLGFDNAIIGSYTFKRNLMDEYKIDGLFAHVKVGE